MKTRTLKNYLSSFVATLIMVPSLGQAFEADFDQEVSILENVKIEQNIYFQQLHEDIANGVPVDIASGQCKYISSIFQRPPSKVVALTFDDGPSSALTPSVLNVLRKYNIKATFFILGNAAKGNTEILRRMNQEGHIVASHSYSHPNFHTLTEAQQVNQIMTTDGILNPYMKKEMKIFRYPYGNSTCYTNAMLKKNGYSGVVGWHVDSCDWAFAKNGYVTQKQAQICGVAPSNMANFAGHVLSEVRKYNGGIVLMHEIHSRTANSLEEIIVRLKNEGYQFTNMDDPRMAQFLR